MFFSYHEHTSFSDKKLPLINNLISDKKSFSLVSLLGEKSKL